MEDLVFSKIDPSTTFSGTSSSKVFNQAPVNKMLKFHIGELERTERINKYKTDMNGKPNPDFGKPQPVVIFKGVLDDSTDKDPEKDAKGQTYSTWITGFYKAPADAAEKAQAFEHPILGLVVEKFSFGDKSKFGRIAEAIAGSAEAFQRIPAGELAGMPFQCALESDEKGEKQYLNDLKIMPADDSQTKVQVETADAVPTDVPDEVNLDDLPF